MGTWDSPPTAAEMHGGSVWDSPPTPEEESGGDPYLTPGAASTPEGLDAARKYAMGSLKAAGLGAMKALTLGHRTDAAVASALDPQLTYHDARQQALQEDEPATQKHPIAFRAGMVAPALAVPAAAYGTLPAALATGAAVGAAGAIADEPSDEPGKLLERGLKGGITGAGLGVAGYAAPAAASAIEEPLENAARAATRRVVSGGGTPMNAGKKPLSDAAADAALEHGIVPFGTTRGTAERLQNAREVLGDQYGRIVAALEAKGFTGPEADALAQQYAAEAVSSSAQTMNPQVPRVYERAVEQIGNKPTQQGYLGLQQAENLKRSAQGMARSAYAKLEPGEVGEAHEDVASTIRQAVEDAIDRQAKGAPPEDQAIAAQFKPIKEELGPVIEASRSANSAAAKASKARGISLTDTLSGAAGIAAHGPSGAALGAVNHLVRTRGASTVAWGAKAAADKLAWLATTDPGKLGKMGGVLAKVLTDQGVDAFNAHLFVWGQTDPQGYEAAKAAAGAE